ncbi:hypothetical protein ANN_01969, partial [Periplaneta americana]
LDNNSVSSKARFCRPGPNTILTDEEEITQKNGSLMVIKKGFPRRKADVIASVKEFLQLNNWPNLFIDNIPGRGWYKALLKRHPDTATRTSGASVQQAAASAKKIYETGLSKYLNV